MKLDEQLLNKNKESEIFSAYVAPDALASSVERNRNLAKELAREIYEYDPEELVLVGSGASNCTLYTAYYYMKARSNLDVRLAFGPTLELEDDALLKDRMARGRVYAILASYSGSTADTVSASRFLKEHGVPRLAITRDRSNKLADSCDRVLAYEDKCLYTSAMGNTLSVLAELLELRGESEAARDLRDALHALPEQMRAALEPSDQAAQQGFQDVLDHDMFYVLGDGALWGLVYQYGYTNLMEYTRVHAGCVRSCEWRHGPLEILHRAPAVVNFLGSDRTRDYALITKKYCEENGATVVTFDSEDYFSTLPELTPFAVHAVSQLFLLYLTTYRGIDMDDYLEMHVKPYMSGETYF